MRKYELVYHNLHDFIIVDKANGFRTHKVSDTGLASQLGLVETLSKFLQMPLYVVHRLDKETSGLLCLTKSSSAAQAISELFLKQQVKKTYFFLTDRKIKNQPLNKSILIESCIEKIGSAFVNTQKNEINSKTEFQFIQNLGAHDLWQATPHTGKPHQIRLHALKLQIPILGDTEHSGSSYHRLALHAAQLEFQLNGVLYKFKSELPHSFTQGFSPLTALLEDSWQRLHSFLSFGPQQCYRLVHDLRSDIQADIYGSTLWIYWYRDQSPTDSELIEIDKFASNKKLHYVLRRMINRGQGVGGKETTDLFKSAEQPETWTAFENTMQFQLRTQAGFSPGLFLDQSENRQWVFQNSENKKVLNLFSYTSGFSVAAALGKAQSVTTVDASPKFIEWSKENFKLNQLAPEKSEFFEQDTLLFLKGAVKRDRKWALIICDPPSFGRTKTTTWKIDKDLPELIKLMWNCLEPQGKILFTCNYEKWNFFDLEKVFQQSLDLIGHSNRQKSSVKPFEILPLPLKPLDFELTDSYQNLTKGLIIFKTLI